MSTNKQTSRSKIAMIEWMAAASYIPLPSPPTHTHTQRIYLRPAYVVVVRCSVFDSVASHVQPKGSVRFVPSCCVHGTWSE